MKNLMVCFVVMAALSFPQAASSATPCCATAADGSSCQPANPGDTSGCIEDPASESCIGGTLTAGPGPVGCVCAAGVCGEGANCTDAAAAGCCKGGKGNDCP